MSTKRNNPETIAIHGGDYRSDPSTNAVVGRLATVISKIIRGKNKTTYTPHMDHGDFVVVKNIEQAKSVSYTHLTLPTILRV